MDRKTSIPPVERVGRIAPVLPVQFFKPFPEQSELRRRNKPRQPAQTRQQPGQPAATGHTIDLKV